MVCHYINLMGSIFFFMESEVNSANKNEVEEVWKIEKEIEMNVYG